MGKQSRFSKDEKKIAFLKYMNLWHEFKFKYTDSR